MPSPDYQLTTPSGLRALKGDSLVSDIDAGFLALAQDLENKFRPPVGAMTQYAGSSDPVDGDSVTRWLICDGRAISRTTYSALFAAVASTYGPGDGSTTFNIPDLRGRVPVGADPTGQHLPVTEPALGGTGGEEQHTLTQTEMPAHTHSQVGTLSTRNVTATGSDSVSAIEGTSNTGSTGGGGAHNNLQPYLAVNHIIRAL